jgi:hypothetical protein
MGQVKLEGKVTDIQISADTCNLYVNGSRLHIPFLNFCIKLDSKKEEWVEMPIDFGYRSNFQLIKGSLIGEQALYTQKVLPGKKIRVVRTLIIKSGKYGGLKYDFLLE